MYSEPSEPFGGQLETFWKKGGILTPGVMDRISESMVEK